MLIVEDSVFESELTSLVVDRNSILADVNQTTGLVKQINRGRPFGRIEVPQALRKLIAEEAILGASHKDISKNFGVSSSSISAYKVGATSTATYHNPDKELKKSNDDLILDVSSSARAKLTLALEHITSDKIKDAKVGTISQIAKDMSSIVRNLEPTAQNVTNNQVIVYRPRQREEEDFEVITVNE
jgi:hypothetical protein